MESVPDRQKLARTYGADEIVDFTKEDVVQRVHEVTGGEGVDTSIEALSADVTFQDAIKVTKPGGTISITGYFGEGEFVHIPRVDWGVGMAGKTIETGLCPWGPAAPGAVAAGAGGKARRPHAHDDAQLPGHRGRALNAGREPENAREEFRNRVRLQR